MPGGPEHEPRGLVVAGGLGNACQVDIQAMTQDWKVQKV